MKRITSIIGLLMFFSIASPLGATAASLSAPVITVNAAVETNMSLTVTLKKNDWNGATISSMDFGTLKPGILGDTLISSTAGSTQTGDVLVWIYAHAQGAPFAIQQTGTPLVSGVNKIPEGACMVTPVWITQDNQGKSMPSGAALGNRGSWIKTNKILYTSEPGTTTYAGIRAYYAIGDFNQGPPALDMVPLYQPAGSYSGTVVITMTA
jgi:hypothetical protein